MKVIVKEPGKPYHFEEIENTLEAMQKTVGGYIETLRLRFGLVLICDEEGILKNKEPNAVVRASGSLHQIAGTFIVCHVNGEEFAGFSADGPAVEKLVKSFSVFEFKE